VSKRYLALIGKKARIVTKKAASFDVEFPLGYGDVWPSQADFNVCDLDLPTTRLILEIGRTGDMSIIVFDREVVFTDQGQVARVPEGWIKKGEAPVVCRAPEELLPLLRRKLDLDTPPDKRVRAPGGVFVPGAWPSGRRAAVYVEAKPKESATQQQEKLYKHLQQIPKAGGPHRPKEGMMHAEFLRLETAASQAFYAYEYSGDKENYFASIREFGATENRAVGRILNFDTFVQEDGRKFPLSACKWMKVNE
jgi:hypothetical protein